MGGRASALASAFAAAPAPVPVFTSAPARLLPFLVAVLLPGCLGEPSWQMTVEDIFSQSSATYAYGDGPAGDAYHLQVVGRVVNRGTDAARSGALTLGIAADCGQEPRDWPGYVALGNLAPGAAANVREAVDAPGPLLPSPHLWYKITVEGGRVAGKGCGPLSVG